MEERRENEENERAPSSPGTPPSPLPVSYGVDFQNYSFASSPSPSPPFSPASSSNASSDNIPLLLRRKLSAPPSVFSLDQIHNHSKLSHDKTASCLHELLKWVLHRCCRCLC